MKHHFKQVSMGTWSY